MCGCLLLLQVCWQYKQLKVQGKGGRMSVLYSTVLLLDHVIPSQVVAVSSQNIECVLVIHNKK
jgi:hypothetical protein